MADSEKSDPLGLGIDLLHVVRPAGNSAGRTTCARRVQIPCCRSCYRARACWAAAFQVVQSAKRPFGRNLCNSMPQIVRPSGLPVVPTLGVWRSIDAESGGETRTVSGGCRTSQKKAWGSGKIVQSNSTRQQRKISQSNVILN